METNIVEKESSTEIVIPDNFKKMITFHLSHDEIDKLIVESNSLDCSDSDGFSKSKKCRAISKSWRVKVESRRKYFNKMLSTYVNGVAKSYQDKINPIEQMLDKNIKEEEKKRADAKAEKVRVESERINKIKLSIQEIRDLSTNISMMEIEEIDLVVDELRSIFITDEFYQEFRHEAEGALSSSVAAIKQAKIEREKFNAEKEAQERQKKWLEDKRIEAEALAKKETEYLAEKNRKADEEKDRLNKEREEFEADKKRTADKLIEEENEKADKLKKERDDFEAEKILLAQEKIDFENQKNISDDVETKDEGVLITSDEKVEISKNTVTQENETAKVKFESDKKPIETETFVLKEISQFEENRPNDIEIIKCVAENFGVINDVALYWLMDMDTTKAAIDIGVSR